MRSLALKFATCCLLISCAYWYARSHFYRDPGSAFFDKARAFDQRYSQYRKSQVAGYIDSLSNAEAEDDSQGAEQELKAGEHPSLCVGLGSVRRERAQYLEVRNENRHC